MPLTRSDLDQRIKAFITRYMAGEATAKDLETFYHLSAERTRRMRPEFPRRRRRYFRRR